MPLYIEDDVNPWETPPLAGVGQAQENPRHYNLSIHEATKEFPPGFHGANPGPSHKPRVRVKAICRPILRK